MKRGPLLKILGTRIRHIGGNFGVGAVALGTEGRTDSSPTDSFCLAVVGKSETNAGCYISNHGKIFFLFTFYGESKADADYRSIHISLHQFEVNHFLATPTSEESNAIVGNRAYRCSCG